MNNKFNLIRTKLIAPIPRKNYIKRTKLQGQLEEILDYKITVVKGAAGSGKSTLLSSFIKEKTLKNVRWISLDKDNNQLYSFWYYLIASIKEYLKEDMEYFDNALSTIMKRDDIFNIIPLIINELSEADDILIVLDDYHYIKDKFLNDTMEYFIKYSNVNMHFVFLTREEIPMYLGDLRVNGELLEIEEDSLKFTENEAISFIGNTLNLNISKEAIVNIFKISEGWVAGIQLIAIALKNKKDNIVKDIKGLNKYVIEYLTQEILKELTIDEKNFLIKTSVLSYFDYEMCNDILDINNSEELIESLINKNLFIIVVDEENNVFRYHHLFKEFLNLNFCKIDEEKQKEIHIKAYEFFKKLGDLEESIKHLIEIKLYDEALIEIKENSQRFKLWSYLKEIPLKYILKYRELIVQRIFYHFCNLEVDECRNIITTLEEELGYEDLSQIKILKVLMSDYDGNFKDIDISWVDESDFGDVTKSIVYLNSCSILLARDEFKKVIDYANKGERIGKKNGNTSIVFFSKGQEAMALEELGDLNKAEEVLNESKKIVEEDAVLKNMIFMYHLGIAGIYIKRYDLKKAEEEINLAYSYSNLNYGFADRGIIYNLMEIKLLKGEIEDGIGLSNKLIEGYINSGFSLSLLTVKMAYIIPMNLHTVDDLVSYKKLYNEIEKNKKVYIKLSDKIIYARIIYLLGEEEQANHILNGVIEYCRKESVKIYLVNSLILKIIMLEREFDKRKREVFNLLREAFGYSIDNMYIKPYIQEKKLFKIIKKLKEEKEIDLTNKEKNFIKVISDFIEPETSKKDELLSQRENEVLEVLAEGASNKEIGEKLNISLATVKTHMINIYSKLGVSNRVQAVEAWKKVGENLG